MEPHLREQVKKALAIDNLRNAIFFGERLCATSDSEENVLLLARAYVRNSQDYRAVELLQKVQQLSSAGWLLLAQCMFRLKSEKAEFFILKAKDTVEMKARNTPDHSNEHYILAEICYLHGLLDKTNTKFNSAIKQFRRALSHNPFLWPAFEDLCNLGADRDVGADGHVRSHLEYLEGKVSEDLPAVGISKLSSGHEIKDTNNSPRSLPTRTRAGGGGLRPRTQTTPIESRGLTTSRRRSMSRGANDRAGKLQKVTNPAVVDPDSMDIATSTEESAYFSASEYNSAESFNPSRPPLTLGMENDESGPSGLTSQLQIEQQLSNNGFKEFCHFLYTISKGIHALALCKQEEALQIFNSLPGHHQVTPWIQAKLGILAAQKANYSEARVAFSRARDLDSTHVEDMDLYSSVLFLLNDTARLNSLSKEMVDLDRLIPQTWCAAGNANSALRDHKSALDCFKRAIQMDPSRAYSYTLCGHTLLALDDHSKARQYFKQAVCLDRGHHFGWYGLGLVEFHSENFAAAASNFERSIRINPTQAVLRLQFGRALAKLGKLEAAEKQFKASRDLDKNNKAACLEQGKLYFDNKRFEDAERTFQEALSIDAKDPDSFYQLGLAHKRLGNRLEATSAFYNALDLKPGSVVAANIRAALDRINQDDDDPHRKY